jgi:large subunit ribosomal protein L22
MPKTKSIAQNEKVVSARASFVHTSPRKLRLVANAIRGKSPTEAVAYLSLLPHRAAGELLYVFEQGLGNAKNNIQVSPGDLVVKTLQIQEGPRGPKKADVHSHGARFDRGIRRKRMSHIYLELVAKGDK